MAGQVLSSNSSRADYENLRDLLSAVSGVIFLGTRHRGSSFAALAGLKISLGSQFLRVTANKEIITILKPESYILDELQRTFSLLDLTKSSFCPWPAVHQSVSVVPQSLWTNPSFPVDADALRGSAVSNRQTRAGRPATSPISVHCSLSSLYAVTGLRRPDR